MYNSTIVGLAALVPILVGFIWYNPKVFGKAWIKQSGLTEEYLRGANMPKVMIFTFLFSLLLTGALTTIVIHQTHVFSILANEKSLKDPNSELSLYVADFMNRFGNNFRTFKHGAFHGTIASLLLVWPVIGIVALFERRGAKYIAIHLGFWIITFALMGGILCQFLKLG